MASICLPPSFYVLWLIKKIHGRNKKNVRLNLTTSLNFFSSFHKNTLLFVLFSILLLSSYWTSNKCKMFGPTIELLTFNPYHLKSQLSTNSAMQFQYFLFFFWFVIISLFFVPTSATILPFYLLTLSILLEHLQENIIK